MREPPRPCPRERRVVDVGEASVTFVATVDMGDMVIPGDCHMHVGDSMVQNTQYTRLVANARGHEVQRLLLVSCVWSAFGGR